MMNEMRSHLPDLDAVHSTGIDLKTKSEPLVNRQLTLGTFARNMVSLLKTSMRRCKDLARCLTTICR